MSRWRWYWKVFLALALLAWGYWVWPTPYVYFQQHGDSHRRNRFTSRFQIYDPYAARWKSY